MSHYTRKFDTGTQRVCTKCGDARWCEAGALLGRVLEQLDEIAEHGLAGAKNHPRPYVWLRGSRLMCGPS